ncbi:MAG: AAA family ATPase [Archangium sp.]
MLLVFFGLPGAGKTFVAKRLAQRRKFHFHDGDDELPADMRDAIARAAPVTPDMRDRFVAALISKSKELISQHANVAFAQTFLKAMHRERFRSAIPAARFVLVTAPEETRVTRLARRAHQPLEPAYARAMTGLFDPPPGDIELIANDGELRALDAQLDALTTS